MLRSSLCAASLLLLTGSTFAQSDASSEIQVHSGPIRNAGTYHLGTKTWTRPHQTASRATSKVLYANTCLNAGTVVWTPARGQTGNSGLSDGRMPSTTSPNDQSDIFNHSYTGKADEYTINGVEILYVTGEAARLRYSLAFYDVRGATCTAVAGAPAGVIVVPNLPGAQISGSVVIWAFAVDWKGTTLEFNMFADGDGTFDNDANLDNFGHEHHIQLDAGGVTTEGASWGYLGDPLGRFGPACPWGANTYYGPANLDGATGLASRETYVNYTTFQSGVTTGCFWFGSYYGATPARYSSFALVVLGDNADTGPSIKELCNGSTGCPCANNNNGGLGVAGCANSAFATGARATAIGTFPAAMQIQGTNVQPSQFAISLRGSNKFEPGIPIFDGLLCVGGQTARSNAFFSNPAGLATSPILPQGPAGVQWNYQIWYRDTGLCAGSNLSNAVGITW